MDLIFAIGFTAFGLILGAIFGSAAEKKHLTDLALREQAMAGVRVYDVPFPTTSSADAEPKLHMGEVAIASDYLKSFVASLIGLVGGEMKVFETLMNRARREALLRLKERAHADGYNAICNVRLSTADIGGSAGGQGQPMVAMIASGTCYREIQ